MFQGLKKCIDQVYSTYLPKNSHPFVYLSLELDPKDLDVNVHPTKHEVQFLHEEQIIEIITTELETKLLGSNNSRVFYTQAKLPVLLQENISSPTKDGKEKQSNVYDKNLVRTDSCEQKLEKFFGAPIKQKNLDLNQSLDEEEFKKQNAEFLKRNQAFEDDLNVTVSKQANITIKPKPEKNVVPSKSQENIGASLLSKVTKYCILKLL